MRSSTLSMFAALLVLFASAESFAANVYCKIIENGEMKIYNAAVNDGHYECADHLREGAACFTGSRGDVISLINSGSFDWDEEWLEGAHYKGFFEISYVYADGPNDLRMTLSMDRCSRNFFKNAAVGPVMYRN